MIGNGETQPWDDRTIERIGPYRVLDVLGEGGMGIVYLAEQVEPLRRRVAIKVIKLGMDSKQVLARFEAERQALALMDHPNIAIFHDAGITERGQPFFVMEYVGGLPITEHCDRQHLSTRGRLELFMQVCAGVQHAHLKGVIHRDLKPSNVLVKVQADRAVPKIIDFGLARAADQHLALRTLYTERGRLAGTPEYMSPEQAELSRDIDGRTDVYSLGVILYELLVGMLPLDACELRAAGYAELERCIREDQPARPSARVRTLGAAAASIAPSRGTDAAAHARQLRGDLDWITMKALEKDRERRYRSARELRRDIERHLGHETVRAGAPGVWYRMRKFARRHRRPLVVCAAVFVSLVAGLIANLVLLEDVVRQRRRAQLGEVLARSADLGSGLSAALRAGRAFSSLRPDAGEMRAWLAEARPLLAQLPDFERALAELRQRALVRAADRRARDRVSHPAAAELHRAKQHRVEHEDGHPLARVRNADWRPAELRRHLTELDASVIALERAVATRWTYDFDDDSNQRNHDALASAVDELAALRRLATEVEDRVAWIRSAREMITAYAPQWADAMAAVQSGDGERASELYRGLRLPAQPGLVPIGRDPDSKLWEFAHVQSGAAPERDPRTGELRVTADTGLVFVLIPAGSFLLGAQSEDPDRSNYDPLAGADESPVRLVRLSPFLLSKFEMTRAQWQRLTGTAAPYAPGPRDPCPDVDAGNPVVGLSWSDSDSALRRRGLLLPTEAQWEYARRAGAGPDDSRRPFGLRGMPGGAREWCRDVHGSYLADFAVGSGLRLGDPAADAGSGRAIRGGEPRRPSARASGSSGDARVGLRPVLELEGVDGAELRFDFGTRASAVAPGWLPVHGDTRYSAERGYGWKHAEKLQSWEREGPNQLLGDLVNGQSEAEFRVDVPNGLYEVALHTGDVITTRLVMNVRVEGQRLLRNLVQSGREFTAVRVRVAVTDERLELVFTTSGSAYWAVNALRISPADTLAGGTRLHRFRATTNEEPRRAPPGPRLAVTEPARWERPDYPTRRDYLRILERFPLYGQREDLWHPITTDDGEELGWFGAPERIGNWRRVERYWRMTAMAGFVFVSALLATEPAYDSAASGVARETLLERARQCLRYMTRCHVEGGDLELPDGRRWGKDNDHLTAYWTSRMAAGARLLWDELAHEDRERIRRVLAAEADVRRFDDRIGDRIGRRRSLFFARDGELLAWAVTTAPDVARSRSWSDEARALFMNTFSMARDRRDQSLVDGEPVAEQVGTANVYPDFTVKHAAYSLCPTVLPMSHLAWARWAYASSGRAAPGALRHHYRDVWRGLRRTFLYDNRFACLGGETRRPRYTFGTYYIVPALVTLQAGPDAADARLIERARVRRLEQEQLGNGDGTFFGRRLRRDDPRRSTFCETECYAALGLAYLLHAPEPPQAQPTPPAAFQLDVQGTWESEEQEYVVSRAPQAFTSFSWRMVALSGIDKGRFSGLFVSAGGDDLVEWGVDQLVGSFVVDGYDMRERNVAHKEELYADAFTTTGRIQEGKLRDGDGAAIDHYVSVTGLPADGLMLVLDHAVARADITVRENDGLRLHVANDIFNGNRRTLHDAGGSRAVIGVRGIKAEILQELDSPWVNVDDLLGVVRLAAAEPFVVRDAGVRNAPCESLSYELISCPFVDEERRYEKGDVVRDTVFVLAAADRRRTKELAHRCSLLYADGPVRVVLLASERGPILVAACFGDEPHEVEVVLPEIGGEVPRFRDVASVGAARVRLRLPAGSTRIFRE